MKRKGILVLIFALLLALTACGRKDTKEEPESSTEASVETPPASMEPEETVEPEESHEGQAISKLTGLWVDEDIASQRPIALMFNNIAYASPQSGTGEASILYEAVVEGGITRLMAIFETVSGDRIGSVRSARHYYVSVADEYDAIFAHFGHTKYATSKIEKLGVDNLSGLSGIGSTVYYRDNSIKAPHNAFASAKGIKKGIEIKGYRTTLREGMNNHFTFHEEDTEPSKGEDASNKVTLGFSGYTSPYFTYDAKDRLYYRTQFDEPHIDKATGEQLAFKNLIIQYVSYWTIDQKNGYQSMDIEDSKGEGLYITDGKAVPITWDKKEASKEMHYYSEDGSLLTVNPGKTYVALYPTNRKAQLILK